jgi:hypothetical protein
MRWAFIVLLLIFHLVWSRLAVRVRMDAVGLVIEGVLVTVAIAIMLIV